MNDMLKVGYQLNHPLEHTLDSGSPASSPLPPLCRTSSFEEGHSDSQDTVGSAKRIKLENQLQPHGKAHRREQPGQYVAVNESPGAQLKSGELKTRKLACPYYKRNPRREGRPVACVHPGFSNVARLKEHLYRIHRLPIECPRCREQFNSDQERTDHLSAPERCTPQPRISNMEGFDKEQELKLRTKKRSKGEGSEEEKWKAVFMILFPEASPGEIPSAYLETDISAVSIERTDQEAKMLNEFKSFSDNHTHDVVKRLNQSSSEGLAQTDQLADFLQKCQSELFRSFRRSEQYRDIIGYKTRASCVPSRHHSRASSESKLSHDSDGNAGAEFYDAQEQKPN